MILNMNEESFNLMNYEDINSMHVSFMTFVK